MFMCDIKKSHLTHIILFTVNYSLSVNGDVSIRFSGKDVNIMLELIVDAGQEQLSYPDTNKLPMHSNTFNRI